MLLLDTSCWMQMIRERSQADDIKQLLRLAPVAALSLTIYSVHSIGIIMRRFGVLDKYGSFLNDVKIGSEIKVIDISISELSQVSEASKIHGLDFDDAYQYVAAKIHGLKLVSLDADFDRTPNGRLTPADALRLFTDDQNKQSKEA